MAKRKQFFRQAKVVATSTDAAQGFVAAWMKRECPDWTVDTLLTHPYQAIDMAVWVLKKLQRGVTTENIHEICRCTINARKRGNIRRD